MGDQQAYEGGSGPVPPLTYDGNGMEKGKDCSVGAHSPCAGQERTTGDVTILRLTASEISPLSEVVILTLPRSCKRRHVDQRCLALIKRKALSTETSTRTTWLHFLLSLTAPWTRPLKPYTGSRGFQTRLPRLTLTRGLSYKKEAADDHSESSLQEEGPESRRDSVARMDSELVGTGE